MFTGSTRDGTNGKGTMLSSSKTNISKFLPSYQSKYVKSYFLASGSYNLGGMKVNTSLGPRDLMLMKAISGTCVENIYFLVFSIFREIFDIYYRHQCPTDSQWKLISRNITKIQKLSIFQRKISVSSVNFPDLQFFKKKSMYYNFHKSGFFIIEQPLFLLEQLCWVTYFRWIQSIGVEDQWFLSWGPRP